MAKQHLIGITALQGREEHLTLGVIAPRVQNSFLGSAVEECFGNAVRKKHVCIEPINFI